MYEIYYYPASNHQHAYYNTRDNNKYVYWTRIVHPNCAYCTFYH